MSEQFKPDETVLRSVIYKVMHDRNYEQEREVISVIGHHQEKS